MGGLSPGVWGNSPRGEIYQSLPGLSPGVWGNHFGLWLSLRDGGAIPRCLGKLMRVFHGFQYMVFQSVAVGLV